MLKKIVLVGALALPFATQAFADDAAPKPAKKAKKSHKSKKGAKKDEAAAPAAGGDTKKDDAAAPAAK